MLERPNLNEYHPYFERYLELVPDKGLQDILKKQLETTINLLSNITSEQAEYQYEEKKWRLKEVVGHMADVERVLSYHLLVIARGDTVSFTPFDKDLFMTNANFRQLDFKDILSDFTIVRQCTSSLISSLPEDSWIRTGTVLNHPMTARALAYIIAGHELHHQTIIKERYLINNNLDSMEKGN
ncbi:DinB family protein [Metabacillus halosaccharovorans]|uniref:DinB family protein n=1 Tax=Metabacillus halosaccharovorans TaxID=930124 RepID=A0ABT3DJJ3_9BACI|nr:DinB family protein [Metabacillus halosaccharovorans]MCV9887218.1 DinB family protein [Metabacillus halosaccharovorans]